MKNFFVGVKPGVGPVLKIMRDDADDPLTTPNTNYGKFLFNSEVQKLGYIDRIIKVEADFTTYPPGPSALSPNRYYLPSGSNAYTADVAIISYSGGGYNWQVWMFREAYFGKDFFPLVEVRYPKYGAPNTFNGPSVDTLTGDVSNRGYTSAHARDFVLGNDLYSEGIHRAYNIRLIGSDDGYRVPAYVGVFVGNSPNRSPFALMTVFNLPDKNVAIPDNSGAPTSGDEVIRIDSAGGGLCRVALPGHDITDPDPENYILHEDKIPVKIIKCGEADVDQGTTISIPCPLPLTPYTYMDFHVKRKSDSEWWQPPYFVGTSEAQSLSFEYTVDTDDDEIVITNTSNSDLTIRYAICGTSEDSPTSGGSRILLKGNDGAQDYVQIKRPGSSDAAPNLNDIMIDTRLSYLPILAEGFLSYPDDFPNALTGSERHKGERWATVNFANPDGMLPLVKVGAVFAGSDSFTGEYNPVTVWNRHDVRVTSDPNWNGRASGGSVWANIKQTSVDFYSGGTNPYWTPTINITSYPSTMLGLRYYIFGIPQSL